MGVRYILHIPARCVRDIGQLTRLILSEVPSIKVYGMASIEVGINDIANVRGEERPCKAVSKMAAEN